MKKSKNIFKFCLEFINWGLFIFYSITVLLECISGFRAEILGVGTQTELTVLDHSIVSNIVLVKGFDTIALSVIFALVLIFTIIFSVITKKGFIAAGFANLVFSLMWLIVYFNNIIQFPSYGYSSLDISDPRPFFNRIMIKILFGLFSLVITIIYIIHSKKTAVKSEKSSL